jgi:hypothetical protein
VPPQVWEPLPVLIAARTPSGEAMTSYHLQKLESRMQAKATLNS